MLIKEFVKTKPIGVVVREYQPQMQLFTVTDTEIATLYAVVGAAES